MATQATTRQIDSPYGSDQHGLIWGYRGFLLVVGTLLAVTGLLAYLALARRRD
jgi:hypothetical protein